ncbi:MAG TPA: adenosylhomocysteinase [Syntrophorhabdus sp.]|jgi:adenosylhomocysteinase|nr:adenosylhomocysteinase [Pseudomonadota bacterium]OQB77606.1 MAG: Adenosylhomocysteinase [Deltaproteobacteria bacterium ADurb.Bin135]HNQ45565.1 adenosylhomocysteinase [Syntrophorhabdus sp.]HNS77262.1 adenosylhomocysteinase [Syntrophorhabdus sp.]HNY70072.1 adenosylhomocysteinase [Syntrophorhabdus sp.]
MDYDVKDIKLADQGLEKIEWAERRMPVLRKIRERFAKEKPLKGVKIACCLHVTTETANLGRTLKEGGAEVAICASNPLSTQDDVAAAIVKYFGIPTYSIKGENEDQYYSHILKALAFMPNITMDDGADLVGSLHMIALKRYEALHPKILKWVKMLGEKKTKDFINKVVGGTEETTTGVIRLKSMEKEGVLCFPIVAVNDAYTKHMFDNRYGTGQSTIDGILRATNLLFAGANFVVAGYGWCGKGIAMRARGLSAHVIVTEVDPLRALEARMDGFNVMDMKRAAKIGDIFISATGDINVIRGEHFKLMKDGAIVGNAGHFNVEIDIKSLETMKRKKRKIRGQMDEYTMADGRKIYLLGEGRLVNLASAEGHPSEVMDMSFANQALCSEYMWKNGRKLQKMVYSVPKEIDENVSFLKLQCLGIKIDKLTAEQKKYLASWEMGT